MTERKESQDWGSAVVGAVREVLSALKMSHAARAQPRGGGGGAGHEDLARPLRGLLSTPMSSLEPLALFEPLLDIVRSESTSGRVTDAALTAVLHLIDCGILARERPADAEEVLELIAEAATHCRFESSLGDDSDEVVLASILRLLRHVLCHPLGAGLEDETVFGMVQTCVRLALQPRFSALLRRTAEVTASDMLRVIFARTLPSCPVLQPLPNELRPGQKLSDEAVLERILVQITESERSEVEKDNAGVVNSQRVQFSKESSTVKKMLESEYSVCCKLFKLLCALLDRSRTTSSDHSVLLGFAMIQSLLLEFGSELERIPGLLHIVQDDLSHNLIHNLQTDNFLILSGALSLARCLFVALTPHIKLQMELIINKLIEWIMVEGVPYQKQEITLEFLVDLLRMPRFISQLYVNYDCDPNCSDLFERIAMFLYKNSYPPDGSLYTTHILTLDGLLSIARSIADNINASKAKVVPLLSAESSDSALPTVLSANSVDPDLVRRRKDMKEKLLRGAQEFNTKKKAARYEYLQQEGLLPNPLTPHALARFFRTTPQLDKVLVGEVLGGNGEFELAVLEAYLKTFKMESDFLGVIRTFLESFKIPGEAQIIQRVLERFSHHFYEAHKHEGLFASEDAVFLLAYAMLILHVDNHSDKIVNKMLESQFKKTLRGTNGDKDFPDEMLSQIYYSVSTTEIKIYEDYFEGPVTDVRWKGLQKRSKRFANFAVDTEGVCDQAIFTLMWGRIIAAIGVVFSNSYNNEILSKATDGFRMAAEISAHFEMSDVFDNLIVTLCKHSHLLVSRSHNARVNPVIFFGSSEKAQTATLLVFEFTRAYGNHLREGWRNIVDAILNLNSVHLLKIPQIFHLPEFLEMPKVESASTKQPARGGSGIFSLFGAGSWFGGDSSSSSTSEDYEAKKKKQAELEFDSAQDMQFSKVALECISKCRIDEIVASSSKLHADSLVYLVKALILGSVRSHAVEHLNDTPSPGDGAFSEEASQLCLDLLTQITLLNEHRIVMIWVLVNEHLADLISSELSSLQLVERSITNLLLLCVSFFRQREVADQLAKSMHNTLLAAQRRAAAKSPAMAYKFSAAIVRMLALNPMTLLSAQHWPGTLKVLRFAMESPDGCANVVLSVKLILAGARLDRDDLMETSKTAAVMGIAFQLPAAQGPGSTLTFAQWKDLLTLAEDMCQRDSDVGPVSGTVLVDLISALDVLYLSSPSLIDALPKEDASVHGEDPSLALGSSHRNWKLGWQPVLSLLCDLCCHRQSIVRHAAISALQCLLLSNQMSSCDASLWRLCFKSVLLPMLEHLASRSGTAVDPVQLEQTRMRAFAVVHKIFLIYMPVLSKLEDFSELWTNILDTNERFLQIQGNDTLAEAVPESLKNVLLVLFDAKVLVENQPLAMYTWERIAKFNLVNMRQEVYKLMRGEANELPKE